jgi:hypothetical protein
VGDVVLDAAAAIRVGEHVKETLVFVHEGQGSLELVNRHEHGHLASQEWTSGLVVSLQFNG